MIAELSVELASQQLTRVNSTELTVKVYVIVQHDNNKLLDISRQFIMVLHFYSKASWRMGNEVIVQSAKCGRFRQDLVRADIMDRGRNWGRFE